MTDLPEILAALRTYGGALTVAEAGQSSTADIDAMAGDVAEIIHVAQSLSRRLGAAYTVANVREMGTFGVLPTEGA
jgi:hypothetical protein